MFASREIQKQLKQKPRRIIAKIREINGGRHGRTGESVAVVEPEYFANGEIKRSVFRRINTINVLKVPFSPKKNTKHYEQIIEVIEIIE